MTVKADAQASAQRVRTDAAFAQSVRAASVQQGLSREDLARQAQVPLTAIHAIHRRALVSPKAVSAICRALSLPLPGFIDPAPLLRLGQLIHDRRRRAGLSRQALGRLAKLSDATVKFVETGRHPPSRTTCLRLLNVPELNLQWQDLALFAGEPPEQSVPIVETVAVLPDSRLSEEMILEQMLLIDQVRLQQYGVESSPAGWRRTCLFCGARSGREGRTREDTQNLTVRHSPACAGQLAASLLHKYPIIQELAERERCRRGVPAAQTLGGNRRNAEAERYFGCRSAAELGEQLAYATAAPVRPYQRGMAEVLLWALGLEPCPLGLTSEAFTEPSARSLVSAVPVVDSESFRPADFLRGVVEAATWLLEPQAAEPQEAAIPYPAEPPLSEPSRSSSPR